MVQSKDPGFRETPRRQVEFLGVQPLPRVEGDGRLRRVLIGFAEPSTPGLPQRVHNLILPLTEVPGLVQDLADVAVVYAAGSEVPEPVGWLDFLENLGVGKLLDPTPTQILDPRD